MRAKDAAPNTGPTSQNSFTTLGHERAERTGGSDVQLHYRDFCHASWTAATDNVAVTSYEWSRNGGSTWTSVAPLAAVTFNDLNGSTNYTVWCARRTRPPTSGPTSSSSFTTPAAQDITPPTAARHTLVLSDHRDHGNRELVCVIRQRRCDWI